MLPSESAIVGTAPPGSQTETTNRQLCAVLLEPNALAMEAAALKLSAAADWTMDPATLERQREGAH